MSCYAPLASKTGSRRETRTGLFLAAMINAPFGSRSVRIRNISSGGALIETDQPPAKFDKVELVRAHLKAAASVAWSDGGRCGLKFHRPVAIEYWVPSVIAERQMAVDRQMTEIRRGDVHDPSHAVESGDDNSVTGRIAEEVAALGRQVELSLDELAGFAPLVVRLPDTLQHLEIVSQTLGHLAMLLTADDPVAMIKKLGRDDLKRRLLR